MTESRRRRGWDANTPWRRVAATPRLGRESSVEESRRRRRGWDANIPWRKVAATPRPRRGRSVETSRDTGGRAEHVPETTRPQRLHADGPWTGRGAAAAATWIFRRGVRQHGRPRLVVSFGPGVVLYSFQRTAAKMIENGLPLSSSPRSRETSRRRPTEFAEAPPRSGDVSRHRRGVPRGSSSGVSDVDREATPQARVRQHAVAGSAPSGRQPLLGVRHQTPRELTSRAAEETGPRPEPVFGRALRESRGGPRDPRDAAAGRQRPVGALPGVGARGVAEPDQRLRVGQSLLGRRRGLSAQGAAVAEDLRRDGERLRGRPRGDAGAPGPRGFAPRGNQTSRTARAAAAASTRIVRGRVVAPPPTWIFRRDRGRDPGFRGRPAQWFPHRSYAWAPTRCGARCRRRRPSEAYTACSSGPRRGIWCERRRASSRRTAAAGPRRVWRCTATRAEFDSVADRPRRG